MPSRTRCAQSVWRESAAHKIPAPDRRCPASSGNVRAGTSARRTRAAAPVQQTSGIVRKGACPKILDPVLKNPPEHVDRRAKCPRGPVQIFFLRVARFDASFVLAL